MKQSGKEDDVIFLGEKSGHYIYRLLKYTDSPLLTIILILRLIDESKKTLRELVEPFMKLATIPEKNYEVKDPDEFLETIKKEFSEFTIEEIDGVSVYSEEFFFNIRKSNTESLVRLNLEADSEEVIEVILEKIQNIIEPQ